jgi:pyruvate, water dikinase
MNEKEEPKIDAVKWFNELNKDSGNIAGGKGANLAEIYNLGISVPPGFVVTAQAYDYFIEKAGIKDQIKKLLDSINYEDTAKLNEITKQIRDLIVSIKFPEEMEKEIIESYEHLDVREVSPELKTGTALDILKTGAEPLFVAVRSSATTEDLADASFAGQQDTYLNIKGNQNLIKSIKNCFASLFTARATYYRNKKGFKHEQSSLAVIVQKMVDSDKSGVVFSKDPTSSKENVIIEAVFGLGEGIVSGKITPDKYVVSRKLELIDEQIANKKLAITRDAGGGKVEIKLREEKAKSRVLKNHEIRSLAETSLKLEKHYQKPQDMEFAIENEELFVVQTRPITTSEQTKGQLEIKGEPILTGLGASPGIASGKIKIIRNLDELHKIQKGDILVTGMTNPDMVVSMEKSAAIVTDEGGLTAHAAIVSREMGIPAVVGTNEATTKLKEGEIITVDGYTGKIYKGKVAESSQKEILPVKAQTKTKIKVMVDLPSFAERAAKTGLKEVGLLRMEGIIAESGKHPNFFLKQNKIQEYEEVIFKGIKQIADHFEELWIRTSDIRTDEFQNLEGAPTELEANPMLGFHGIRYSLKRPEILKAELNALKRVAQQGKKIGILLPQVILIDEVKKVQEMLNEIQFKDAKLGVMIETPASIQLIKDFCDQGINFISFGTNDLTQYMLAVDRGNENVQYLYNEMHPSILYQLQYVIRVAKRNNVETSICGQAGSKKEMVKYLVENGIDSISVNADVAADIAEYVSQLEQGLKKGTEEEPRQYQPQEKQEVPEKPKEEIVQPVKEETPEEEPKSEPILENKEEPNISENTNSSEETKETSELASIEGETPEQKEERIEKDIKAIEEEKKEYLEENKEESKSSEEPRESKEETETLDIF